MTNLERNKMPIYINETTTENKKGEAKEVEYFDSANLHSKTQIIVHFGYGDILTSNASSRNPFDDELNFTQSLVSNQIGETTSEMAGKEIVAPVRLVFDKVESVQVVIDELLKLKESMVSAK